MFIELFSEASVPSQSSAQGRLLLVDHDAVAAGIGHMLRDLGYTYVRSCDGGDALRC